jgi:hypothetical protein
MTDLPFISNAQQVTGLMPAHHKAMERFENILFGIFLGAGGLTLYAGKREAVGVAKGYLNMLLQREESLLHVTGAHTNYDGVWYDIIIVGSTKRMTCAAKLNHEEAGARLVFNWWAHPD